MLALAVQTAMGQQRYACTDFGGKTRGRTYVLPDPPVFERNKVYRQPVVLISFEDRGFSMEEPAKFYDRVFNEKGFNEGVGLGCVADYFRDQSDGLVNLQFDIYGPYQVDFKAGGHGRHYYGYDERKAAVKQLNASVDADFKIYDWDGDGLVNQVLYVAAGYCGNTVDGYIWPNTGAFSAEFPGGIYSEMGSISCEMWGDGVLCGIGTIVHEFCHCLGLPDIYPLGPTSALSAVDEWDLMDGGNYTNHGWCPPNMTAMEKLFLGWKKPTELTAATSIKNLKSVSQGGETYLVRNSGYDDEYYLLEHRRQEGWDYGCPGNGLLIYHVDYSRQSWSNNEVNVRDDHYRFDLFHADNKDYHWWDPDNKADNSRYTMKGWLRDRYLSTSAYPYTDPETQVINEILNDDSTPASTVFHKNAEGNLFMSKAVSNIQMNDDGTISFDFMKEATNLSPALLQGEGEGAWFDLQGRRLQGKPTQRGLYIRNGKKEIIR
jgi:M6 family metalloprotease-like protein